jgi:hypothetical protein
MYRPGVFYRTGTLPRQREFRFLDTMGQLKYNADYYSGYEHRHAIEKNHNPNSMNEQWYCEGHDKKQRLSRYETHQLPPLGPRHSL